ncbi:MAG: 6-phosphofructokinase [Bacillales bacterium]|nr:6-phosphofructokinase [Bacillales bacterium]
MKNAIYFQSGGPTSVINSSFYGVIKACEKSEEINKLYGSKYGLEGILKQDLVEINKPSSYYKDIIKLPGAILGSARLLLPSSFEEEVYIQVLECVKKYHIGYIFVNGGNDSMDTADKLNRYFKKINYDCIVIGIPKTIDNDLLNMDHSPGYGSCVKFITRTLSELSIDINSYKKGRVTIIETMGRDTGWLAASSSLACEFGFGPDLIYVPEVPFDKDKFYRDVLRIYKEKGRVIVVVAEALKDKNGHYISADNSLDSFGHVQLGAISKLLADQVKKDLGINTRNVELSLIQRCASHISSSIDIKEAIEVGEQAVKFALEGKSGVVTIQRISSSPYKVDYVIDDLMKVANGIKYLPRNYINEEGNGVTKEFLDYARPFIDIEEINLSLGNEFIKR